MHRDLKLENIVKVGKLWKLVDFGFAYEGNIDDPVVKSRLGNKYGRAPEILEGRNYNYKSDIWSLGVLCYKLVYNRFPFELGGVGDLDRMKLNPFQTQLVPKGVRERNIQSFISRCLTYKPEDRINWEDIMRHPIMNDSLLDDILVSEIHHTMSGEIVDVDLEIISEIFEQT